MGTDIAAVYQLDTGRIEVLNISRNYALFGLLAGTRGSLKPIVPPRGWPSDLTPETLEELGSYDEDATWFRLEELQSVDYNMEVDGPKGKTTLRELLGTEWFDLIKRMKTFGPGRLIVGFG